MPTDEPDHGSWCCRVRGRDGAPDRLFLVRSRRYPDGDTVELGEAAAAIQVGADAICTAVLTGDGVVATLEVAGSYAPGAPPIWFAELRESNARPPAVTLLAFTGAGVPRGAVLDGTAVGNLPVTTHDQLGALRWYPATGEIDQLYVQPRWRRRHVATTLLAAAELLGRVRDWPRLWADGQRTALGELLRNGRSWRYRAADLTHLHPPMTPADQHA